MRGIFTILEKLKINSTARVLLYLLQQKQVEFFIDKKYRAVISKELNITDITIKKALQGLVEKELLEHRGKGRYMLRG